MGFLGVPAHVGVKGNEEADQKAKKVVKEERVQIHLKHGAPEYTERVNRSLKEKWEKEKKGRAKFTVQERVSNKSTVSWRRKDSVVVSRWRLDTVG